MAHQDHRAYRTVIWLLLILSSPVEADPVRYSGGYDVNGMPIMSVPSLTTTLQDTCMGSTAGGVSVMGVGLSGGSTWKDEECVRRLNAKAVAEVLGDREAAKEIMCGNQEVYAAFVSLGRPCKMNPSYTVMVPGGALASYRDTVSPGKGEKIRAGSLGEPEPDVTAGKIEAAEGFVEQFLQHTGKDL